MTRYSSVLWWVVPIAVTTAVVFLVVRGGTSASTLNAAIGTALAVVAIVLLVRRPHIAPLLLVAGAAYDRHIYYNYDTLQLSTLVLILALTAPTFAIAAAKRHGLPRYILAGSLMLALGLILAIVASPDATAATVGTVRWFLVINAIVGTAAMCGTYQGLTRRLVWWFVAAGAVASVFGLLQRAGKYFLVGPPYAAGVYNSTFGYYSNFANFAALAAVLGVGLLLELRQEKCRGVLIAAAMTALSAYSVSVSLSRGALICMGIGIVIIIVRQVTRPGRFVGILTGIGLLGWLVWALTPPIQQQAFIDRFTYVPGGDLVRQQMQAGGLSIVQSHPLGIGFNNFSNFVATGIVSGSKALAHAHNTFVQMALDAGWLGLAGFMLLVVGASLGAVRQKGSSVRLGAGAALVGFLGQVTQDFFFFEIASLVGFGLVLALSAGKTSPTALEDPRPVSGSGADVKPLVSNGRRIRSEVEVP